MTESAKMPQLYSLAATVERWGGDISIFTLRRLIKQGAIRTVNIGARVMIPVAEIERVEQFGVGRSRKAK